MVLTGKGGVGKSTLSAAVASLAARHGLSVLLVELEGRSGPIGAVGHDALTHDENAPDENTPSAGGIDDPGSPSAAIRLRTMTPDEALTEYLVAHGFGRAARRLARSGMVDVAATGIPGVRDILVLGKIAQLERAHAADLIVLDGPAAGHAATFFTSAPGLLDSTRAGPVHAQAAEVAEFLADPTRCQIVPVTLAEETPVNETVGLVHTLQSRLGTHVGPVIVNGMYPRLEYLDADPEVAAAAAGVTLQPGEADAMRAAAVFRRRRQEMQAEQATRLAEALALPQLWLPQLFSPEIGLPEIERLVDAMETGLVHLRQPSSTPWTGLTKRRAGLRHAASMGSRT